MPQRRKVIDKFYDWDEDSGFWAASVQDSYANHADLQTFHSKIVKLVTMGALGLRMCASTAPSMPGVVLFAGFFPISFPTSSGAKQLE